MWMCVAASCVILSRDKQKYADQYHWVNVVSLLWQNKYDLTSGIGLDMYFPKFKSVSSVRAHCHITYTHCYSMSVLCWL